MRILTNKNKVSISRKGDNLSVVKQQWEKDSSFLYYVVKREKLREKRGKPLGDNCPLLYAIKGNDNLHIENKDLFLFYDYVERALIHHFENNFGHDLIIPAPSSCSVSEAVANILHYHFKSKILNLEDYVRKLSKEEVIAYVNDNLNDTLQQSINNNLYHKSDFKLKYIKPKDRKSLPPIFKFNNKQELQKKGDFKNIILVDDIYSSGKTLMSLKYELKTIYPNATISALTLFSPL